MLYANSNARICNGTVTLEVAAYTYTEAFTRNPVSSGDRVIHVLDALTYQSLSVRVIGPKSYRQFVKQ